MNTSPENLKSILSHLEKLVGFDTRNPPREITPESDIFIYLQNHLPGFDCEILDAGDGCLCLLAKRGKPELLFNFHIDTVPVAPGWASDPFELKLEDGKVTALGACDIKGAAACMLSAINHTEGDVALLFSSDEEHGSSQAIRHFLKTEHGFKKVIVAEPTEAKAVTAHRGIQSATAFFTGLSGHGSEQQALYDNAVHKAAHWMTTALHWITEDKTSFQNLKGIPFNIGRVSGGIKANMIAAECELSFGFRQLPGKDPDEILKTLVSLDKFSEINIVKGFSGPSLPAANQNFKKAIKESENLASDCHLPLGEAVSFWTEASLFSEAGMTTLVYGPGNISQAHTANEWVTTIQLLKVEASYRSIINGLTLEQSDERHTKN